MDEVGLDHLALFIGVLKHMPGVAAVAPAFEANVVHHDEEGSAILGVDPIFPDRQDRAPIVSDTIEEARRPPAHRRRQVLPLVRLQLPRPCERETNQSPRASAVKGERHSLGRRDLAPHRTAERERAEIGREEYSQTPAAHPCRQRDLRRDKKRRQRDDRSGTVNEAGEQSQYGFVGGGEETQRSDGSDRAKRRLPFAPSRFFSQLSANVATIEPTPIAAMSWP